MKGDGRVGFIILDSSDLTEEQLLEAIKSNCTTATLTRQEIEKLKKLEQEDAKKTKAVVTEDAEVEEKTTEEKTQNIDQEFEDEVSYYLSLLSKITLDNIDEMHYVLPSKKHYRYNDILYRLKLSVIKNLKEIKEWIAEEGHDLAIYQEFKEEIELEQEKLKRLTEALTHDEEKEEASTSDEIDNKLIFTLTSGGNIRVFEELDHIEPEFYERFNALFKSIKDGTFKRIKRFASNSEFAGLSEVRGNQVRVVFDRVGIDSYAIITAFVKKTTIDTYYKVAMRKKVSEYYKQCDQIKENLSDEEFVAQHEFYEKELFNKISSSQMQGSQSTKKKGCE